MVDKSPARAARQRIGTALSRHLLSALRASAFHAGMEQAPLGATMGLTATELESPTSPDPGTVFAAQLDTQQGRRNALAPVPESGEFRVYSSFGHNVQPIPSMEDAGVGSFPMATEDEDHLDVTADESAGLPGLLDDPIRRRSWLLAKALEKHPLDQALDLARTAEAFITGFPTGETTPEPPVSDRGQPAGRTVEAEANRGSPPRHQRVRLALTPEERERVLGRLAQGARNNELASEFNLSPKQVQGIRIGSAREISRRRNMASNRE